MANLVAPNFDQAYSALLEDLSDRGMLKTTIVTAMGEFGRTPKINPAGGRDHHPGVWTILMGGGPIQGGRIVGESDELGYCPEEPAGVAGEKWRRRSIRDWASTRTTNCRGRRAGRCRWRTTVCGRLRSCFESVASPGVLLAAFSPE